MDEKAVAKFAAFCALNAVGSRGEHPDAPIEGIVDPFVVEYVRLFGHQPSAYTTIMVVLSGCVVELPQEPGRFVHASPIVPKIVVRVLEHLKVKQESVVVGGTEVLSWCM